MDNIVQTQIDSILYELNFYTELLYSLPCTIRRDLIMNQIRNRLSILYFLNKLKIEEEGTKAQPTDMHTAMHAPPPASAVPAPTVPSPAPVSLQLLQASQRTFSLEDLSKYDGKNGNSAYVAINKVIYDVTNNASWTSAIHFGLSAGRDLTHEFYCCHNGQKILEKLTVVGRLI